MARNAPAAKAQDPIEEPDELDLAGGEVIANPVDLRGRAKERKLKAGEKDAVAAAEAAMKEMEGSFGEWMRTEIDGLDLAWRGADEAGYVGEAREAFYRSAHDIKGQASTLGFPVAGRVAACLCRLLDHAEGGRLPRELVRQHVQAVRAIVNEDARDEGNPVAQALAGRLEDVTEDFIASL